MIWLEERIKRIEAALLGKQKAPITFQLIFFGKSDGMPTEPYRWGNVTIVPALYDDLQPVASKSNER